ncbi:polysaccharide pyruvyl transferase family protein [Neobacillus ginsengisoli]|uniref:Pyruvyl transferase EpsI n=1 Tax=Neobacillus ginsengisoli TaxID=904295 RepID=A0ABT9XT94_9BACI|nr:polysaccharide pyruvyl transferase family protein [Neobacillus ginsengisoli]MDQ0198770.1 pyruvyl transferase EpsI [Neobacillus ginsengisoli]
MLVRLKYPILNFLNKYKILDTIFYFKNNWYVNYLLSKKNIGKLKEFKNKKKIFYCLTPCYGNMGDQAIAYATNKYLSEHFKDYEILEFERDEFFSYAKAIKSIVNKEDIIIIQGGGNMGNLYIHEEKPRRFIVKKFTKSPIISMTQTLSFTNDDYGRLEKQKTQKIYNRNKNLILLAREEKSYQKMSEIFENKIIKVPDIVFYLEDIFEPTKNNRNYILTCLRDDKESFWKDKKLNFLENLQKVYKEVLEYDTVVNKKIYKEEREEELFKMWDVFRNAKVVITDRLHGMIFAVLTKTPCIVLRSADHKVIESYKWINDLNYLRFTDDLSFNSIKPIIDELSGLERIDKTNFKEKYFNKLVKQLGIS